MTPDTVEVINGIRVLLCGPKGPVLCTDRDASEVIGVAFSNKARLVAIPVERLCPDFFQLRTLIAGEMLQKFMNYHFCVAIVGDISAFVAGSTAFRDFVVESNRGPRIWFVADYHELECAISRWR